MRTRCRSPSLSRTGAVSDRAALAALRDGGAIEPEPLSPETLSRGDLKHGGESGDALGRLRCARGREGWRARQCQGPLAPDTSHLSPKQARVDLIGGDDGDDDAKEAQPDPQRGDVDCDEGHAGGPPRCEGTTSTMPAGDTIGSQVLRAPK